MAEGGASIFPQQDGKVWLSVGEVVSSQFFHKESEGVRGHELLKG